MRAHGDSLERRRRDDALIEQMRHFDPLTGLPNWELLVQRLNAAMAQRGREDGEVAVLLLNIDGFDRLNDTAGPVSGDYFLHAVAARLVRCVGATDTVARRGSDEFCILLERVADREEAAAAAARLLDGVAEPLDILDEEYALTASVGISLFPRDAGDANVLLSRAGVALHQAKRDDGDGMCFYSPGLDAAMLERQAIETGLRHALDRNEMALHYQPQVNLATGQIEGVEALLRWRHAQMGTVAPARFIPIAEETGQIAAIGEWAMREACRQGRLWHDAGFPRLQVAVNLSPRQFQQRNLVQQVGSALAESGFPASSLELEITEGALMTNPARAARVLHELKDGGVRFSVDDFGTGYSSLGYLKRFPLDRIKIDRSFVAGCCSDPHDGVIVKAIAGLSCSLGLESVAEGVEDEWQRAFVRRAGCTYGQGYFHSPPLPAAQVTAMLLAPVASPQPARVQP